MQKNVTIWTYQHPKVVEILQSGARYCCPWERVYGKYWKAAFVWMAQQMKEREINLSPYSAPIWAWHSVSHWQGKPDEDCYNALFNDLQKEAGIVLLTLEVPRELVLLSGYGSWNEVLDCFLDGSTPLAGAHLDCFRANKITQRRWTTKYFKDIQACLPYIEPEWMVEFVNL